MKRLALAAVGLALVVGIGVSGVVGNPFDGKASASTAAVGGRLIELGTGTISGTVTDEGGSPIQGCWMHARPYSGSGTERWGDTGPDGTYTIAGLTAGSYRVQAQCAGPVWEYWDGHLLWVDADPVPVTEGADTPNINFSLRIGGTVSGTVTDSGGNPIADAWVSAVPFAGGYGFPSVLTAADGTYTTGGLFTGQYRVEVWVPGYVGEYWDDHVAYEDADPVAVTEGLDTPDINFSLRVDGTISGVVTGAGASPIAGCWVYASPYTGSGAEAVGYTGPDGAYSICCLATGSYRVQAPCTGYVNEYWDDALAYADADPVAVTEGSNTPGINFALQTDPDGDGVPDSTDNCPLVSNPGQENTDAAIDNGPGIPGDDKTIPNAVADSVGDACETDPDIDNDGLPDSQDTNPLGVTGICAALAGASDGHPNPAGGDVTNDDDHDGDPASPMGTDVSDNGPSWDTDNDGVRDGVECALGHNPRDRADKPTTAECGGTGDTDGDDLLNAWETCGWGTNPNVVDSDGDTLGDCKEAADVNGDTIVSFVGDTIYYARAALLPRASFGKTMDFDIDKNGLVDFPGDVIQEAKFGLVTGLCK